MVVQPRALRRSILKRVKLIPYGSKSLLIKAVLIKFMHVYLLLAIPINARLHPLLFSLARCPALFLLFGSILTYSSYWDGPILVLVIWALIRLKESVVAVE